MALDFLRKSMLLEKLFATVVLIPEFEIFAHVAPGFEVLVPGLKFWSVWL